MFGDNKSVVDSSMQVHAKLHKRHTMLSFHRVREAIASGYVGFHFINGSVNPADILSKHWGHAQVWDQLKLAIDILTAFPNEMPCFAVFFIPALHCNHTQYLHSPQNF